MGLSLRTSPLPLLERTAVTAADVVSVLDELVASPHVGQALVLSTCNRVELFVDVDKFHPGVGHLSDLLARRAGVDVADLGEHLYVHYEDAVVQHMFTGAAGLDSMVVGEAQILGQLRAAYAAAQQAGSIGRSLHDLCQQALRVGKRVHSDTRVGSVGRSLVAVGIAEAASYLGGRQGCSVLVCGAGATATLAVTTLQAAGVRHFVVANRTPEHAVALATTVDGRVVGLDDIEDHLVAVDLVISATATTGRLIAVDTVERAVKARDGRPLVALDLALPRDIDPEVADLAGVTLIGLEQLRDTVAGGEVGSEVEGAAAIVVEEVGYFLAERRSLGVAPTVAALRSRAAALVDVELARLAGRLPQLDDAARAEVELAVRRVVAKLLHTPTVRVKELATVPGGDTYARALRELFGLDAESTAAVTRAQVGLEEELP